MWDGYSEGDGMKPIRELYARLRPFKVIEPALPSLRDVHVYGGIGLAAYGAGAVYSPAAYIVAGVLLLALGLRGGR
jgi:hypothetical protein